MQLAQSKGKDYTNSLKGMKDQSEVLARTFKTQQQQVKELRKRYEESARIKGEDSKQTQNLAIEYNKATASMNRTELQLRNLNSEISRMSSPWTKLGEHLDSTGKKMKDIGSSMSEFGSNYSLKVTAPIVAGGVAMFKAASDYESAFAGVRKTIDMSEDGYKKLSDGIRGMAKELPASAIEIAKVAEAAGQLGIEKDSILSFTRTIIDLGESTNLTLEQASSEFARFANITGMSQKDFDRLGSSVVALGNSMATTEAEIVEMGMRLAAQGKQVGMSESQIMALSATMSSLGINAEAGGTAMTTILKKIQMAVGAGGKDLEAFAKAAGTTSKEFKKAFEDDAAKALDMLIKNLSKSGKEGENLTTILESLGIKGIYESDTLLRLAGASDLLSSAVNTSSTAWKENSALTDEAAQRYKTTESQLKMMWNRAKDLAITLGESLIPATMDAIDAAEPLIKQIESGAKAFSEMDKEQQETIIKMVALAAAVGPAAMVLGSLTSSLGNVLSIGGSVAKMFGKAGGGGLIGRIGMLAPLATSPVGLAIAGVGALALGTYALGEATKVTVEDTLKSIETRKAEIESIDSLIESFGKLQDKNKLTTEEMLKYMDIMSELEKAETEEAIKKLTDEQAKLLEKSGLTNEEMALFLELNGKLVEKAPEAAKAISDQGNAYVDLLDSVKKLNEAERNRLTDDTYLSLRNELDNQKANLERQKELQSEIGSLEKDRTSAISELSGISEKIREQDQYILELKKQMKDASWEEQKIIEDKLLKAQQELLLLVGEKKEHDGIIEKIDKQIGKKDKSLEKTQKELDQFDQLAGEYEAMILLQAGLTSEKGKGLEKIQQEQKAIDVARQKLEAKRKAQSISTQEYENQNSKLNTQQGKLNESKQKLIEINQLAGGTVYKEVEVSDNGKTAEIQREAEKSATKNVSIEMSSDYSIWNFIPRKVNVGVNFTGGRLPGFKSGTKHAPGGPALVGEEGFELAKLGNKWSMLNFGITDLPKGTQVFTHAESKKILRAIDGIPAYANGVSSPGEAKRVTDRLNQSQATIRDDNSTVVNLLKEISQGIKEGKVIKIGGKAITEVVNQQNAIDTIGAYF